MSPAQYPALEAAQTGGDFGESSFECGVLRKIKKSYNDLCIRCRLEGHAFLWIGRGIPHRAGMQAAHRDGSPHTQGRSYFPNGPIVDARVRAALTAGRLAAIVPVRKISINDA